MFARTLLVAASVLAAAPASATVFTTSFAAWRAGVGQGTVVSTTNTGLFDPFALVLPTTAAIPLADGHMVRLSTQAQVTQPQNGFPYLLPGGSSPDLFIPVDATGNQVTTEQLSLNNVSAFGFTIVPFSSTLAGPFSFTVRGSDGLSVVVSLPGGDFNTGTTAPVFVGYYGGAEGSLTIITTDPNGFAFGNFVAVPEPASIALLAGMAGLAALRRRARPA